MDSPVTDSKPKALLPYFDDFLLFLYNYERDLRMLINFATEEKLRFEDLNKQIINRFKAYLISRDRKQPSTGLTAVRKLEPRSVNRVLSATRTYLRYLIDIDKPVPIPPDAIKMVKTDKKHPQVAELSELIKLIESPVRLEKDELVGIRNRAMLEVLLSSGLRISGLVSP